MSNLVPVKSGAVEQAGWTQEQVALVKRTLFKDATDDELKLFMHVALKSGLDPFARQIYAVKRQDYKTGEWRMTIQTSIDGFRLIAARTNAYAGKDEAAFEYNPSGNPTKCKVTVYKLVQGVRCAFTATAKWDEYYPGDKVGFMWKKLPETMLEKCCEAKALRMAFPAELSGLYSTEEMQQADREVGRIVPEQPEEGDGVPKDAGYRIPFGKYAKRSLEEVGPDDLKSYVQYIKNKAAKDGKPLVGQVLEFVERAEDYIKAVAGEPVEAEWSDA